MKKLFVLSLFGFSIVSAAWAQDPWREGNNGVEFDCSVYFDAVALIESEDQEGLIALSAEPFIRYSDGRDELTLGVYLTNALYVTVQSGEVMEWDYIFTSMSEACADSDDSTANSEPIEEAQFNVVTSQAVNLRECAGTTCAIVRQSKAGEVFAVVGAETAADGEWYEVRLESGVAFVASLLTSRAPDAIVSVDEIYRDPRTGCEISFRYFRGEAEIQIVLYGDQRHSIKADVMRPNENRPIPVLAQTPGEFAASGDPYLLQYYSGSYGWPLGVYSAILEYEDKSSVVLWEITERGRYGVLFNCDEQ